MRALPSQVCRNFLFPLRSERDCPSLSFHLVHHRQLVFPALLLPWIGHVTRRQEMWAQNMCVSLFTLRASSAPPVQPPSPTLFLTCGGECWPPIGTLLSGMIDSGVGGALGWRLFRGCNMEILESGHVRYVKPSMRLYSAKHMRMRRWVLWVLAGNFGVSLPEGAVFTCLGLHALSVIRSFSRANQFNFTVLATVLQAP